MAILAVAWLDFRRRVLQAVAAPSTYRGSDADRSIGRRRRAHQGARRPGNDFRLHAAYSIRRGGNREDPLRWVPRSGWGAGKQEPWARSRNGSAPVSGVQSMRKGCPAYCRGHGRDVLEGTLASADLVAAGRGPGWLQLDGCGCAPPAPNRARWAKKSSVPNASLRRSMKYTARASFAAMMARLLPLPCLASADVERMVVPANTFLDGSVELPSPPEPGASISISPLHIDVAVGEPPDSTQIVVRDGEAPKRTA